MKSAVGACPFCGQFVTFEIPDTWDETNQEAMNECAKDHCTCYEANTFRTKRSAANYAEKYIRKSLGEHNETATEVALAAVMPIINGDIESITIDAGLGRKLTMKASSKLLIKAKFTVTEQTSMEQ